MKKQIPSNRRLFAAILLVGGITTWSATPARAQISPPSPTTNPTGQTLTVTAGRADVSRAGSQLGWRARYAMPDVARMMVEARLARSAMPIRRIHGGQSITTLFSL